MVDLGQCGLYDDGMLMLEPLPKIITFDCYGTLVQWHRKVREAANSVLHAHRGATVSIAQAASLADDIRAKAVEHQNRLPYCDYASVLRSSLAEALSAIGVSATDQDHEILWTILSRVPPHPDTAPALERLRARYGLAIISNTADDLIAGTVTAIGVPINFVITAEEANAYKPDHRLFEHAYASMGVTKDETIHVGMGQFTDLKVCSELGIRSVWIDREGEPLDPRWPPDAVLPDLSSLPELLRAC